MQAKLNDTTIGDGSSTCKFMRFPEMPLDQSYFPMSVDKWRTISTMYGLVQVTPCTEAYKKAFWLSMSPVMFTFPSSGGLYTPPLRSEIERLRKIALALGRTSAYKCSWRWLFDGVNASNANKNFSFSQTQVLTHVFPLTAKQRHLHIRLLQQYVS